jgi:hypothetical protein
MITTYFCCAKCFQSWWWQQRTVRAHALRCLMSGAFGTLWYMQFVLNEDNIRRISRLQLRHKKMCGHIFVQSDGSCGNSGRYEHTAPRDVHAWHFLRIRSTVFARCMRKPGSKLEAAKPICYLCL